MSPERQRQPLTELPLCRTTSRKNRPQRPQTTKRCFIGLTIPPDIREVLHQEMEHFNRRLKASWPKQHSSEGPEFASNHGELLIPSPGPTSLPGHESQVTQVVFRRVAPANYHITLAFLGALNPERLQTLQSLLRQERWFSQPLALDIESISGFPSIRQSRYIVAQVPEHAGLSRLHQHLRELLAQAQFPTEERALRPHITLARAKGRGRAPKIPPQPLPALSFAVERLTLYESQAGPDGSNYQVLADYH